MGSGDLKREARAVSTSESAVARSTGCLRTHSGALTPTLCAINTVDVMDSLKKRLQAQQERIKETEGTTSTYLYRAELDALWACVEVLAKPSTVAEMSSCPTTSVIPRCT